MLNVRFVVTHLSHGSPGSFYRPYELAKQLISHNIDAKIFTPSEYDVKNITDVPMICLPNIGQKLKISNIGYNAMRKFVYNKFLSHIIPYDKLLLSLSNKIANSLEKSLDVHPDILQGEQEVAALASIKVGKKLGIPVTVDIHNIWPEELVSTGHIKRNSDVFKNLMNLEQKIVENADHVIVVNDFMKNYIMSNFKVDDDKLTIIPPGGEIIHQNHEKINHFRFMNKKIVYSGLVNPREHVDLFIKSIPEISKKHSNIKFVVAEKGESINEIKNLCKKLSVNPDFYWFESRNKARSLLKECYVATLPSKNDIGRKLGTPLKLLEYMSNGLPVVANDVNSWCDIIREEKIGILTKDDPKDFAAGINSLIEDEKMYTRMQTNMINLMNKKFSWKLHVEQLLLPVFKKIT
jgi:glycosyltransferase involved in cell wall biosynthesis